MRERGQEDDLIVTHLQKLNGRVCVEKELVTGVRIEMGAEHHGKDEEGRTYHLILGSSINRVRVKKEGRWSIFNGVCLIMYKLLREFWVEGPNVMGLVKEINMIEMYN